MNFDGCHILTLSNHGNHTNAHTHYRFQEILNNKYYLKLLTVAMEAHMSPDVYCHSSLLVAFDHVMLPWQC